MVDKVSAIPILQQNRRSQIWIKLEGPKTKLKTTRNLGIIIIDIITLYFMIIIYEFFPCYFYKNIIFLSVKVLKILHLVSVEIFICQKKDNVFLG